MHALAHSPLSLLLVQAIALVSLSRLLGKAARWMGQPLVVAEIVAGILLGPSFLGAISPGVMNALFPASSLGNLNVIAQVGLVLFMFLVGLELDPRMLRGRGHASVVISHSSILVPFALGGAAAWWLRPLIAPAGVDFLPFALFLGTAMSITAFPVLARILTDRRLLGTRIGTVAITCAAVDDVTAWCLLACVVSVARAKGLVGGLHTTLFTAGFILLMFFVVRPFLKRMAARVASREGLNQNLVAVMLVMLLAASWATETIGIHALFGAFVLGVILPKDGTLAKTLAEKLEDLVVVLLLPLFFAYSGLRTQVGLLDTPKSWAITGLLIVLASLGKFGGSALAARLMRHTWRESAAVGILMNTRGLVELIVLNVGLDLGVLSPTAFTMLVLMALVTTFATTPLLSVLMGTKATAPAADAEPVGEKPFSVVMCVADRRIGPTMLDMARKLAGTPQRLFALALIPSVERPSSHVAPAEAVDDPNVLAPLLERAETLGAEVKPLSFVSRDVAADICSVAEAKRADLILLGSHRPLITRAALGGTVRKVMREARAPVGVLVDRAMAPPRNVLVAFQGSEHDRGAVEVARKLAQHAGASVTVLRVRGKRSKAEPMALPTPSDFDVKTVVSDDPVDAVLGEAGGYDLLVVGVGEIWGLDHQLFGMQPERLIRATTQSLLIVHQPSAAEAMALSSSDAAAHEGDVEPALLGSRG